MAHGDATTSFDTDRTSGNIALGKGYALAIGSIDKKVAGGVAAVSGGSTIAHGLGSTPDFAVVTASVSGHIATISARDATNITIDLYDPGGNQVTSSENVYWLAIG